MDVLNLFKLDKKVALVTGGSRGIGRIFALALAEAGADVVVSDIDEKLGNCVCEEIRAFGRRNAFVKTDVTKKDEVAAMVSETIKQMGSLDIAVNGAALYYEDWEKAIDVCLNSVYYSCMAEALEMKKKNRGKIVNISSISGIIVNAGAPYCVAKAGVIMLSRCMARDLAGYNINVNCISPSYTLTMGRRKDNNEIKQKIRSTTPMGWYQRPEDMVGTLLYLVSDASNYITGQNIVADGGHLLNDWLLSMPLREVAPLVSPEEEIKSLIHDMDLLGTPYDENYVAKE